MSGSVITFPAAKLYHQSPHSIFEAAAGLTSPGKNSLRVQRFFLF
jgi:hypothetical protein